MPGNPRRKTVSRIVYAAFISLAAAFVISSTVQIARAVFAEPDPASAPMVGQACAEGVRTLAGAVDRAIVAAASGRDGEDAARRYREAKRPEWDEARQKDLMRPCDGDPRGGEAVAAITRFDRAAEGAALRQTGELALVRRAVDSFIR